MENQFVGYNEAKQLSELGFSEQCFAGYLKEEKTLWIGYVSSQGGEQFNREYHILAPTYYQAFKFFREKHELTFYIEKPYHYKSDWRYVIDVNENEWLEESFKTYEEAELECLKKLIEIAKEKK